MRQTVDALWICYICKYFVREYEICSYISYLREASASLLVQLTGQCEGLQLWDEQQVWLSRFFVSIQCLIGESSGKISENMGTKPVSTPIRAARICLLLFAFVTLIPSFADGATWADRDAYVISWYDKNQDSFDISTAEELAGVAYLVNNNFASFQGKTINIQADIDLSGRTWIPIGTSHTTFQGSFDGKGHSITNIDINYSPSSAPYGCGFWMELNNTSVKNVTFEGTLTSDINTLGLIAYSANNSSFSDINIISDISCNHPEIHTSTAFSYSSQVGGMIGTARNCTFSNIESTFNIDYVFGSSSGDNCYGDIQLHCGGLVGKGNDNTYKRCHAINSFDIVINGYVTTSTYTNKGDSFIVCGGIVGYESGNYSKIISCLVENKKFTGDHPNGTFDTKSFRLSGIASMSKYDSAILKNCVAINRLFNVTGHYYSWQASWYHTNAYFGGIGNETPKYYGGCYSNNDVVKNISMVQFDRTYENGSTSFSEAEMNTQSFVDELNFYSQLEFDTDSWCLNEDGKLSLKNENNSLTEVYDSDNNVPTRIYSVNGIYVGNSLDDLEPGTYIIRKGNSSQKILLQ